MAVCQRDLTETEQDALCDALRAFLQGWTSHQHPVRGDIAILHDRFLVLAGYVEDDAISGCGTDASSRAVARAADDLGIRWGQALDVLWLKEGRVQSSPRSVFRQQVRHGVVTADTLVFDLGINTLGSLRHGHFLKRAGQSWHARSFGILGVSTP